jgi:4-diphosphocytidyl-2-C-methyl-D-erythritol kinase
MAQEALFAPAYAKINLTLAALGKRSDGYHDLASVMQTISLHDTLSLRPLEPGAGEDTLLCDAPELAGPDNLVARAVALLRADCGDLPPIEAQLHKEIPAQGGLGGGSADAATTLVALDELLGLGLSTSRLEALAARLGSDTPYLVTGGTARIAGRGERIEPLPDCEPLWIALVTPAAPVSTATLFGALTTADYGDARATDTVAAAIRAGASLPFDALENTLESVVFRLYSEVARARDHLLALGAPLVRMSGSGPSLYAPSRSVIEAEALVRRARAAGARAWLCHTVTRGQVAASRALTR